MQEAENDSRVIAARQCEPILERIAQRYAMRYHRDYSDLYQEGYLGILYAVDRHIIDHPESIQKSAKYWIKKYILNFLRRDHTVKLSDISNRDMRRFNKASKHLADIHGRSPSFEDIIEFLGLTPRMGIRLMVSIQLTDSAIDFSNFDIVEEKEESHENRELIVKTINIMPPRDRYITIRYFGLDGNNPENTVELGARLGISEQMVRKIKKRVIMKMRDAIEER